MTLKYPNQRLAIYDRLVSKGNCIDAFADTARACGLLCSDDLSEVKSQHESGGCGSLTAARKILEETVPECAEDIWQQLHSNVEKYKLEKGKPHCRGLNLEMTVIDCSRLAPVVMDHLLQLMTEYGMEQSS